MSEWRRGSGTTAGGGGATAATENGIVTAHHMTGSGGDLVTVGWMLTGGASMGTISAQTMRPAVEKLLAVAGDSAWWQGCWRRGNGRRSTGRRSDRDWQGTSGVGAMIATSESGEFAESFFVGLGKVPLVAYHGPLVLVEITPLFNRTSEYASSLKDKKG